LIYLIYIASLALIPVHGLFYLSNIIIVTFSFFLTIALCILFFKTENTMIDALKGSLLATLLFQVSHFYVIDVLLYEVNLPMYAFLFLCFLGIILATDKFTLMGKEKATFTASACIVSLWGSYFLLNAGVFQALFGYY